MFKSFFPQPVWFFSSLVLWFLINLGLWHSGGSGWGVYLGMTEGYHDLKMPIGISRFWAPKFLWFYLWFFVSTAIFATFWYFKAKHPWQRWSVWGSAFILFNIWFGVQVNVVLNEWYSPFYDQIQNMLTQGGGDVSLLYQGALTFIY
ncbi:MAG TPA: peptide transporter, partial [Acinetobacter sp.]|nr:peptide transporter [Acinetobacter sp.]